MSYLTPFEVLKSVIHQLRDSRTGGSAHLIVLGIASFVSYFNQSETRVFKTPSICRDINLSVFF